MDSPQQAPPWPREPARATTLLPAFPCTTNNNDPGFFLHRPPLPPLSMPTVVCFGEIVWDILPTGKYLGGAPYNVAYHLAHLGCTPQLVSAVGQDPLGHSALEAAAKAGINTALVSRHRSLPTGTVTASLDAQGQASYTIHENVAWDKITAKPTGRAGQIDAVVYGSLALRSKTNRRTLSAWLREPGLLGVCDLNLRPPFDRVDELDEFIRAARLLKLNRDEAARLASGQPGAPEANAAAIARNFGCPVVCITLGADGALVHTGGQNFTVPSPRVVVRDTIGAGDAFTAALLAGLIGSSTPEPDWPLLLRQACALGSFVASRDGAQPAYAAADVPGLGR